MNKETLFNEIKKTALLKGHFILRSGQSATEYFDKYLFESSPSLLKSIVPHLKTLIPSDTEILAGLEMGGIPLTVALSLDSNIPCVFVRKKAKEYGTKKITEGCSIQNKKVCVVEDVITTGGQVISSTQMMRKEGALIKNVICVIYRGERKSLEKFQKWDLNMHSLFTWSA
ncbi:MAG: orotate phosphoribosyltransferase [Oligoflexia bacterium]|nr:orotate phosphoribosyltransferase [Oligoflexia bacterium]